MNLNFLNVSKMSNELIWLLLDCPTSNAPGCVVIKFEPLVLHIQCRDIDAAKLVHTASVEAGFRNSGENICLFFNMCSACSSKLFHSELDLTTLTANLPSPGLMSEQGYQINDLQKVSLIFIKKNICLEYFFF